MLVSKRFTGDPIMVAQVTEQGVLVPKGLLGNAQQVEIIEQPGRVVIVFDSKKDPIWGLGENPISLDVSDASVNLDKYLYDNP
jgi:hypothetical protein